MARRVDLIRLQRSVDWALRNRRPSAELVRMLRPLVEATEASSQSGILARLQLAERLLDTHPGPALAWEAALFARFASQQASDVDHQRRAHGALGLALTILGHYRAARAAYSSAMALEPGDPICAHNLGHLLVTQFGALEAGLRWLRLAHAQLPESKEIAASLAHACVLAGQAERGLAVLYRVTGSHAAARELVAGWLGRAPDDPTLHKRSG